MKATTEFHIAVLDSNNYEITMYKELLKVDDDQSESDAVEKFLSEKHNLDEIQFMFGYEPIAIND